MAKGGKVVGQSLIALTGTSVGSVRLASIRAMRAGVTLACPIDREELSAVRSRQGKKIENVARDSSVVLCLTGG